MKRKFGKICFGISIWVILLDLIFVDLGDTNIDYATLNKADEIATHILVFLVRGVVNPFKYSFANFTTTNIQAIQLFPLFWKAVSILELSCLLKIIATSSDGASCNRKLFFMHFHDGKYKILTKMLNLPIASKINLLMMIYIFHS